VRGFIGSHLTDALVACGDDVIGLDAFTNYYAREKRTNLERAIGRGLSLVELDLSRDDLPQLLDDVDGVLHLAAQPRVRGSWGDSFSQYVRDNILASQRLFETAAPKRIRVVMASSSSVYGNAPTYPTREDATLRPVSPYGVTKQACESLARTYVECFGLRVVLLRYFSVHGPRQRPDMAFARIISALLAVDPFVVCGTGGAVTTLHVHRRRGRGHSRRDGRRPDRNRLQRGRRQRYKLERRDRNVRAPCR
jgi:UDP-glucuronate 4-epimerase